MRLSSPSGEINQSAHISKERADRLKYLCVNGAGQAFHVPTPRVAQRFRVEMAVSIDFASPNSFHSISPSRRDVGHITRWTISFVGICGFGVERAVEANSINAESGRMAARTASSVTGKIGRGTHRFCD